MRFLRWGSSHPQRHDNGKLPSDSEDRGYHTAPRVWGFYAFSRGFASLWLLGWGDDKDRKKNNRFHWIRDEHGKKVRYVINDEIQLGYNYEYRHVKRYSKRERRLRRINRIRCNHVLVRSSYEEGEPSWYYYEKPNYFNFSGEIWHHLEFFEYSQGSGIDTKDERWEDKRIRLVPEAEVLDRCGSWIKTNMRTYRRALHKYSNHLKYYCRNYWSSPKTLERNSRYYIAHDWEEVLEVYIEKLE